MSSFSKHCFNNPCFSIIYEVRCCKFKNNLNLRIKTEPITDAADATVFVWFVCTNAQCTYVYCTVMFSIYIQYIYLAHKCCIHSLCDRHGFFANMQNIHVWNKAMKISRRKTTDWTSGNRQVSGKLNHNFIFSINDDLFLHNPEIE